MVWYRTDHVEAVYECEEVAVKGEEL
jgi:hypothetical protein